MSEDLLDQLAEYGRKYRAAQAAIPIDEIVSGLIETPGTTIVELEQHAELSSVRRVNGKKVVMADTQVEQRGVRSQRRWLVGAAAAVVVAFAVVGIVVFRGDDSDPAEVATAGTDETVPDVTEPDDPPPSTPTSAPIPSRSVVPVVPADALQRPGDGEVGATSETPLPDVEGADLVDPDVPLVVLDSVDDLPNSARLDFLAEFCDDEGCFRDAQFRDKNGALLGGAWVAGEPFHIRHGFVNDGPTELGDGFDLAVYAFSIEPSGRSRAASGPTQRYTTDFVVRGETDACGPNHKSQTGTVACEWLVHDFPNGLPEGRWALWAVWEAPCSAWIDLGRTTDCDDPEEVMSFFSSGVDSPFAAGSIADGGESTITEAGGWTRVDGADVFGLASDGTSFFSSDGFSVRRSVDGATWEEYAELGEPVMQFEELFEQSGSQFGEAATTAAVRDGRLVAVEDLRGNSVIVHIVEPDGTRNTQVVPVEIPAAYEPFHRRLNPGVHLLDGGRIVITASYSADAGLVEATGRTRAELGLDLFYPMPRPIVVVSADGVTWDQQANTPESIGPPWQSASATTATGGLVAPTGPVHAGQADRVVSFSSDGVTWEPVIDPDTGEPMRGGGAITSTGNRAFLMDGVGQSRIWEVANGEARLIAGPGAAQEPLELFGRGQFGELAAGEAGLAFVLGVDEYLVEMGRQDPLPDGPGIWYSGDEGETWEFEPFPTELATGYPSGLSIGATQIVLLDHSGERGPTLWVRDFPD